MGALGVYCPDAVGIVVNFEQSEVLILQYWVLVLPHVVKKEIYQANCEDFRQFFLIN